ncbi:tetratricopeptide repeat protein [Stenotrophomonas sp. MYb238]|uniref:transglutaminase-like domain-containing protein n=1 Tax=Stenotrophomonas sp. MYb238 TaxID=2040281 RepID=UPI00129251BC|nr:transglutaminase-like domain-containing protein [Stenotrophomonas sp. MYb238]MQP77653.1 tetratricopeptide repeat protein [Stenotrophomonas sp. MYb238]
MIGWNAFVLLAAVNLAPSPPATMAAPPTPEQVMAVPPELRQQLQERVIDATNAPEQRLQRIVDLVFKPDGLGLQYDTTATLTVAETWEQHRANCLSFTLLFVALAREAGLEARIQEVGQVVTWYQEQGVIYNAGHVNVGLRVAGRHGTLDLDQNVLYDRRGPRVISDQRALAHYYNNRGAELMATHDAEAMEYLRTALRMDPAFAPAWNNLGVLERRRGDARAAALAFDNALRAHPALLSALSNATSMYRQLGDTRRAAQLGERLQRARDRDPFYQFMQGVEAERRGDYAQATAAYRHAIRLYGNAHQFHFGLARAYFLQGENQRAMREMARARELGGTDQVRAVYQAKLDSLHRINARQIPR